MKIPVKRLDGSLALPRRARHGDAGLDLLAREAGTVESGSRLLVPTGVAMAIPDGFVGLVAPRSGLAARHGVTVANAPGVVDSGYRGELTVALVNHGADPFTFERGDRIGQLLIVPVATVDLVEVDDLPESERGSGGFGSTGV